MLHIYIYIYIYIYVLECNKPKLAFLFALMKNVASTGYICSRIQLNKSSFLCELMKNVACTGYIHDLGN